jgi:hypothetical protein
MLNIQGEDKKPQFWVGASLRHFGTNPYSEPIWRVIWAPSRMRMIGGRHTERDSKPSPDREILARGRDISVVREWVGYKWYPMYPKKECYVLEKWLSSVEYGGSKASYEASQRDPDTGLLVCGPYPERGEYFGAFWFPSGAYPAASAVEAKIRQIAFGKTFSYDEHRRANLEAEKKERRDLVNRGKEIILDSLPAHGLRATDRNPARRKPEDYKLRYAAEDLGLPVGHNKTFTRPPTSIQKG